jgi:hypothetical protein
MVVVNASGLTPGMSMGLTDVCITPLGAFVEVIRFHNVSAQAATQ